MTAHAHYDEPIHAAWQVGIFALSGVGLLFCVVALSYALSDLLGMTCLQSDRARMDIQNLRNAVTTYHRKYGRYPDTDAGLLALVGAQLIDRLPVDPWEREYRYELNAEQPIISSLGSDRAPGGTGEAADISSKDLK